jgi:hypothetical protein
VLHLKKLLKKTLEFIHPDDVEKYIVRKNHHRKEGDIEPSVF